MQITAVASTTFLTTPTVAAQPVQQSGADPEQAKPPVQEAVDRMNAISRWFRSTLTFKMDESAHRIVVTIIDKETGEVIRQIPPESVLKQAEALKELSGMLFDKKA
jgi:flagellar protein FlaG